MTQRMLVVTAIMALLCFSLGCPDDPGQSIISGDYVLTEPSTVSGGLFEQSDVGELSIDVKTDGTFYLRFPEIAYAGSWTVTGTTIELQLEMWGSAVVWTGTVGGDTISLDDGSIWTK
jgi:hypothetical protein